MSLKTWWKNEPVRLVGQVQAGLAAAAAVGFVASDSAQSAIITAASGLAILLGAEVARVKVTPTAAIPGPVVETPQPVEPGPVETAVADFDGLTEWIAAKAEAQGKTVPAYLAWFVAGVAHKR